MGCRYSPEYYVCISSRIDCINPHDNTILYSMVDENYHEIPVKPWAISEASANGHPAKYAPLVYSEL